MIGSIASERLPFVAFGPSGLARLPDDRPFVHRLWTLGPRHAPRNELIATRPKQSEVPLEEPRLILTARAKSRQ
jgi:hypothetical protein